jgi:hypothetical protein
MRRVPQVRFLNLGLGVDVAVRGVGDASGAHAVLRQGRFAFRYVQLLSAAAAVEVGARTGATLVGRSMGGSQIRQQDTGAARQAREAFGRDQ